MSILGWILISILVMAAVAVVIFFINPSVHLSNVVKENNRWTALAAIIAALALIVNAAMFWNTRKLFVGQNTPLIDVTPVVLMTEGNFTTIFFSITNYSGFTAHDISIDLKLDRAWIMEWIKANNEKALKPAGEKLIGQKTMYSLTPGSSSSHGAYWPRLESGETVERDKLLGISGYLKLQKVCPEIGKGVPSSSHAVQVRATWKNDHGHVFDEVHQYSLVCTLDQDTDEMSRIGYSFTLVPDGIVSRKDNIVNR